jgi:integrase
MRGVADPNKLAELFEGESSSQTSRKSESHGSPAAGPMRIHDLRHTCAKLLLAQGVHAKVVQEILGHSQISLPMDTYSTVLTAVSRAAAEQMDALLRA